MLGVFTNVRRWIGPAVADAGAVATATAADSSSFPDSVGDLSARQTRPEVLRVVLRMVLRDVRLRAAMDRRWLELEVVDATSLTDGVRTLQGRLVLRFWAPGLPACAEHLERLFMERLCELDPESHRWFRLLSWRPEPQPGQFLTRLPSSWPGALPGLQPDTPH